VDELVIAEGWLVAVNRAGPTLALSTNAELMIALASIDTNFTGYLRELGLCRAAPDSKRYLGHLKPSLDT
jgi:hypothetical protein